MSLTYCNWSNVISSTHTVTQTTPRSMGSEVNDLSRRVSGCIDEVLMWMKANRLQLNPAKSEVLWCSSLRRQHQILTSLVQIGSTSVLPVSSVRDLGVYLDADVVMKTHITAVARSCSTALRHIRSVRRSLPQHTLLTLIRALVISKVDYCCSILAGISGHLLSRLVGSERRHSTDIFGKEIGTYNSSTP